MKKLQHILFSNKVFSLLFCFLLLSNHDTFAQKLHMFIFTQNSDAEIGSTVDADAMEALGGKIKDANIMQVYLTKKDAANVTFEDIKSYISSLNASSNDVIWIYYSGHGRNHDGWPKSAEKGISLTSIYNELKSKPVRMTLCMFDACTYGAPREPITLSPKITFLKNLMLSYKGHIMMASASSGQLSWGGKRSGGIFTTSLLASLKSEKTWEDVFRVTKSGTESEASRLPCGVGSMPPCPIQQTPIWHHDGLAELRNENGNALENAPDMRVQKGDTWETIADDWNYSNPKNKITASELKAWNKKEHGDNPIAGKKVKINR